MKQALIDRHKKLNRLIDKAKSESTISKYQHEQYEIREKLVSECDMSRIKVNELISN